MVQQLELELELVVDQQVAKVTVPLKGLAQVQVLAPDQLLLAQRLVQALVSGLAQQLHLEEVHHQVVVPAQDQEPVPYKEEAEIC